MLSYPKNSQILSTNLFKFQQNNSKSDQAHCSDQIRIMTDPNSQSFQHLLHNKPAKVNHNLKSFQTYFTFKNFFFSSQQYYFFDSLTYNSYDVCSRLFNAKFIQNFNRSIKLSIYQFKKQADESIVKKNTLMLFEL